GSLRPAPASSVLSSVACAPRAPLMNLRRSICCLALLALGVACKKKDAPQAGAEAAPSTSTTVAAALGAKQQSHGRAHLPEGCDLVVTVDWQRLRAMKSMKADIEAGLTDLM